VSDTRVLTLAARHTVACMTVAAASLEPQAFFPELTPYITPRRCTAHRTELPHNAPKTS
jgi:hypothetical protein